MFNDRKFVLPAGCIFIPAGGALNKPMGSDFARFRHALLDVFGWNHIWAYWVYCGEFRALGLIWHYKKHARRGRTPHRVIMKKVRSFQKLNVLFFDWFSIYKYLDKRTKHLGYDFLKKVTANQKITGIIANTQENIYKQSERDRQRWLRELPQNVNIRSSS